MIKIAVLVFNPFQENTYIISDSTGECAIIDAGNYGDSEDEKLKKYIEEKGLKPTLIINTHGHVDHMLGVDYAKSQFNAPFALHGDDNFLIESAQTHGTLYGFNVKSIPSVDIDMSKMSEISFGETTLQIIHTPGHTPGHVSLFEPKSKSLFCGDTLFKESIGRTDLPGGDYTWIMKSILESIVPLGEDVNIFPGHGPKSDIGHETRNNPFIVEVVRGDVNY